MRADCDSAIQHARELATQGNVDRAIAECHKILKKFPNDPRLYVCLADFSLQNQSMAEAVSAYAQAAMLFRDVGAMPDAVSCYKHVLKIEPNRPEIFILLGDLRATRGHLNNAIADYLMGAKLYGQNGVLQKASELYQRILALHPQNICVRLRVAELYLKQGLTEEGMEEYLRVAEEYERSQKPDDARSVYEFILQQVPGHAEAARRLHRLSQGAEGTVELEAVTRDVGIDETSVIELDATRNEEQAVFSDGNGARHATENFDIEATPAEREDASDSFPLDDAPAPSVAFSGELEQELETQYELALAYKDMNLLDAAIETFEQAMRAPNRFLDSCAMIAMCHKDRGLKRTAIEWLERALRNPRCDGALALYVKQTLAELYESEGLLQRAGEFYACVPAIRDAIERMRATESDKSAGEKSEQPRKTRRRTSF